MHSGCCHMNGSSLSFPSQPVLKIPLFILRNTPEMGSIPLCLCDSNKKIALQMHRSLTRLLYSLYCVHVCIHTSEGHPELLTSWRDFSIMLPYGHFLAYMQIRRWPSLSFISFVLCFLSIISPHVCGFATLSPPHRDVDCPLPSFSLWPVILLGKALFHCMSLIRSLPSRCCSANGACGHKT